MQGAQTNHSSVLLIMLGEKRGCHVPLIRNQEENLRETSRLQPVRAQFEGNKRILEGFIEGTTVQQHQLLSRQISDISVTTKQFITNESEGQ